MARLYANENMPLPVVHALRQLGHDVLTTADAGNANRAMGDEAVLAFACEQDRIMLTLNRRHFVRLHSASPVHSGIIVCSFDPDFEALAQRIHEQLQTHSSLQGALIRVTRPG